MNLWDTQWCGVHRRVQRGESLLLLVLVKCPLQSEKKVICPKTHTIIMVQCKSQWGQKQWPDWLQGISSVFLFCSKHPSWWGSVHISSLTCLRGHELLTPNFEDFSGHHFVFCIYARVTKFQQVQSTFKNFDSFIKCDYHSTLDYIHMLLISWQN